MVVSVGLPVWHQGGVYNCVVVMIDGVAAGLVAKRFLAGDGIHYEPRWFKAWPVGVRDVFPPPELDGEGAGGAGSAALLPIGDLIFDIGGVRLGFEICEDAWVAARPGAVRASGRRAGLARRQAALSTAKPLGAGPLPPPERATIRSRM